MKYFDSTIIDDIVFYNLKRKVRQNYVKGLISRHEAHFLYCAALKGPQGGKIVEIGSFYGFSTIFLASACKKLKYGKVTAIDPHYGNPEHKEDDPNFNSYTQFCKNIHAFKLDDWVDAKVMPSSEAIKKWSGDPIRLLWIDGNHDYEFVKLDYDLWSPFLIKGGILAFHDATLTSPWTGPKKLVQELSETNLYAPFKVVRNGIAWTQKL